MDEPNQENSNDVSWGRLIFYAILAFLVFILLSFLCEILNDKYWPYRLREPSPTGEYALEQRYMDWGPSYRCHTYLVAGGRYYKVSNIGPGGAYWVDDETFSVGYRFYGWHGDTYTVSDFTGSTSQKGADADTGRVAGVLNPP